MNLIATYKYQLHDHKFAVGIYYLIIIAILFIWGITASQTESLHISLNGFDSATVIFLFVMGLCTFKETFLLMIQNGISRKTLFTGKILTMVTVGFFMCIVDKLLYTVAPLFSSVSGLKISAIPLYTQAFSQRMTQIGPLQFQIESIFFEFILVLAAMAIGYFITIMFYRLNKLGKVIVGAGVPLTLWVLIPLVDSTITNGRIFHWLSQVMKYLLSQPSHFVWFTLGSFLAFTVFGYLLIRRAVVKD